MKTRLKKSTYVECSLKGNGLPGSPAQCLAHDFFLGQGILSTSIAFRQSKTRFKISIYLDSLSKSEKLSRAFLRASPRGLKWETRLLEPPDWRDKWMLDYRTQNLGASFVIVPEWERKQWSQAKRKPIYIEPGSAFGSGTHETTRLVVRLMERELGSPNSFFDIGVGTGILSVVAASLGAKKIQGIDYDGEAVKVARANFRRNGFKGACFQKKNLNDFSLRKSFDLVCANVLSSVLVQNKKKIISLVGKGKYLVACGILKRNEKNFLKDFKDPKLQRRKMIAGRRWIAVLYQRIK